MAVVLKSNNGGGNKKSPVTTWLSYGAVAVFGFAIIATTLLGGSKAPDPMDSAYSYSDFKDLADMPFSNEEAEAELLSSVRYGDIAKNDLINALFSEEDKEARQAEDALNGVPEPPDDEYAEAAKAKEKVQYAKERYQRSKAAAKAAVAKRTEKAALSASSTVRANGGGSGVTSTIWRADDKKNTSSSSSGSVSSAALRNQLAQNIKDSGGRGGFMAAYDKSRQAANTNDLEAAHALAADAFQNAGDLGDDLKGELEEAAEGLDINKAIGEIDKEKRAANTLDEKLDKAKADKEKKDKPKKDYKCDGMSMNGKVDMGCVMSDLMKAAMDIGKQALTSMFKKNKSTSAGEDIGAKNVALSEADKTIERVKGLGDKATHEDKKALAEAEEMKTFFNGNDKAGLSDYTNYRTKQISERIKKNKERLSNNKSKVTTKSDTVSKSNPVRSTSYNNKLLMGSENDQNSRTLIEY